jgi:hypothetical protein
MIKNVVHRKACDEVCRIDLWLSWTWMKYPP